MVATLESYVCSLRILLSLLSRELYSRSKTPIQGGVGGASGSGRTPVFEDVLQVVFDWQLKDLQPGSSDKRQGDSQGCFGQWLSDLVGNAVHRTSQKVAVVRIITKSEGRPVLLSVVQKQSVQEVLTPTTTTTTHYYYCYYYYYYYYPPLNTHLLPVSYLGGSLVAGLPAVNWGSWGRFYYYTPHATYYLLLTTWGTTVSHVRRRRPSWALLLMWKGEMREAHRRASRATCRCR